MSDYRPDRWCVVSLTTYKLGKNGVKEVSDFHYRVFGCWTGGYLGADHWKLNSGITSVTQEGDSLLFNGSSGGVYECRKTSYGQTGYGIGVLTNMIERSRANDVYIEVLPEDTDFLTLNYGDAT